MNILFEIFVQGVLDLIFACLWLEDGQEAKPRWWVWLILLLVIIAIGGVVLFIVSS